MARVVSILAGLDNVPAATINRFCASSLQTLRMAFHAIKAGEGHAFVAAGVEAVSRYRDWAGAGETDASTHNPRFEAARKRTEARAGSNTPWTDPRLGGRMPDVYIAMGQTAENVATSYGISRAEQDAWAVLSQNRAEAAIASGFYAREITPYTRADGSVVDRDDSPRPGVTRRGRQRPAAGLPQRRHRDGRERLPAQRRGRRRRGHERHRAPASWASNRWRGSSPPVSAPCPRS